MSNPDFRSELAALVQQAKKRLDTSGAVLGDTNISQTQLAELTATNERAKQRLDAAARIILSALDEELRGTDRILNNAAHTTPGAAEPARTSYTLEDLILDDNADDVSHPHKPSVSSSLDLNTKDADFSLLSIDEKTVKV